MLSAESAPTPPHFDADASLTASAPDDHALEHPESKLAVVEPHPRHAASNLLRHPGGVALKIPRVLLHQQSCFHQSLRHPGAEENLNLFEACMCAPRRLGQFSAAEFLPDQAAAFLHRPVGVPHSVPAWAESFQVGLFPARYHVWALILLPVQHPVHGVAGCVAARPHLAAAAAMTLHLRPGEVGSGALKEIWEAHQGEVGSGAHSPTLAVSQPAVHLQRRNLFRDPRLYCFRHS